MQRRRQQLWRRRWQLKRKLLGGIACGHPALRQAEECAALRGALVCFEALKVS